MKGLFKPILMIILILGIATSLFAIDSSDHVLYLKGEITAFTAISITEDGVEISSNLLGFNYTVEEEGPFKIVNMMAG